MTEIWKDIKDYEGLYQISNFGRVKSLVRAKEKILTPDLTNRNYCRVKLQKNKIKNNFFIHRLVAITFLKNPYNKEEVNHKDKIRTNNYLNNLEWSTRNENLEHKDNYIKFYDYEILLNYLNNLIPLNKIPSYN